MEMRIFNAVAQRQLAVSQRVTSNLLRRNHAELNKRKMDMGLTTSGGV